MSDAAPAIPPPPADDRALLDDVIRALAPIERPPGSSGEREAANWLVERLRAEGCTVSVDEHPIHGDFWSPVAALSALAVAGGLLALKGRHRLGGLLAAVAGAGLYDEITCRTYVTRRLLGRRKTTPNVVAQTGDETADRTVVVMAHHDAARSGLVFHPGPQRFLGEHAPALIEANDTAVPMWWPVLAAPTLVALGALTGRRGLVRTGAGAAALSVLLMADIARHGAVPGANDNLTGVAVLVALARRLRERPIQGVRVILLSAGAEESLQEGIRGFAERHFASLPRETTRFVNVDTVGCPTLVMLEGEGAVRMEYYEEDFKDLAAACAERDGIPLRRGMRARTSTDGVVPMRAGYPTVTLVSMNAWKALDNYHWPTDVPDNVNLATVEQSLDLTDALLREVAAR
jgi:hypothetical protein